MTTDNPSSILVQRSQYNPMQSAQALGGLDRELWSNGQIPGVDSASPSNYPAVNHANTFPQTRYTIGMRYDDPPHRATGPAEQQWNQCQCQPDSNRTPEITQYIPIASGPLQLEQYAPAIPDVPNDLPPRHIPLPYNMAGPSRGNPSRVHAGMSAAEDLKDLASDYLQNPYSHVNKLRMRRSRSGTVKVLIFLEIDDAM